MRHALLRHLELLLFGVGLLTLFGTWKAGTGYETIYDYRGAKGLLTIHRYELLAVILGVLTALFFTLAAWIHVRRVSPRNPTDTTPDA